MVFSFLKKISIVFSEGLISTKPSSLKTEENQIKLQRTLDKAGCVYYRMILEMSNVLDTIQWMVL